MGRGQLKRELAGVGLLVLGAFVVGALLVERAGLNGCTDAGRLFGPVGACTRAILVGLVGIPAALLLPGAALVHALRLLGRLEARTDRSWLVFLLGAVLLVPIAIGLANGAAIEVTDWAGAWGNLVSYYMARAFGPVGAWLVVLLGLSTLAVTTLAWNPARLIVGRGGEGVGLARAVRARLEPTPRAALLEPPPEEMPALEARYVAEATAVPERGAEPEGAEAAPRRERRGRKAAAAAADQARAEAIAAEIEATDEPEGALADGTPPLDALDTPPARNSEQDRRALDQAGEKLMSALRTFKVEGELVGRTTGPTVTQFEIEPAAGVKVRQIATLSDDLALAMRAASIRIVAPIPGRGAVGVEVPNPSPEMVTLREIVESADFRNARAALPIALGKDLEGKPVVADLAKMPHLLIAGATGSGKSVCVNTIITSLIYRHTPRTLRFLMVDPKMVELSVYNALPHLRHKVITDNRDAAAVLKWAVMEMQERYALLAANGCRNLQDFNKRVRDGVRLEKPRAPDVAFEDRTYTGGILPYIVVVIDEMADLMMTVQGEVETPIAMLAQKARAIGIHLILATQRPSVNVITGLIKANFPSRIAFRVASQVDSRTIIDGAGAEMLLGNGDMLFIPPGKSEPSRLQGAFLSSDETERLMGWYEARREAEKARREAAGLEAMLAEEEPDILEEVRAREALEAGKGDEQEPEDGERDKLFRDAAEVVIQHQGGSTSLLQRRLKIGYGRAARIIDQLHLAGVLGPPDGSKPRDVLMGLEDLDRIAGPRG
ncbi:MAG TPA: DNA translocase FtsK [Gemmatimonadaceae bacterium]|nr:DNA translocase FtsK [Gemmatimonadaceae bacterium]